MLEEKTRNLVLHSVRIERFRTISGHRDPSLSRAILAIGELGITTEINESFHAYTCILRERFTNALSGYRLSYINFYSDCHADCPNDCRNDFSIDCLMQINFLISGARL